MKIIVVGDGKVGLTLTEQLSKEEHDIVVIDKNPTVLQNSQETFDVMVVPGNGASRQVLLEAGAQDADRSQRTRPPSPLPPHAAGRKPA